MCKKKFTILLLGVVSLFASCIDHNYDLANKEISTDVKLEGNKIALPVGSLKPIVLDSLIDVDDIDILEKNNGVYGLSMENTITVDESVEPFKLAIKSEHHEFNLDFKEINITSVHINATDIDPVSFSVSGVSLDGLNEKLPVLKSNVPMTISNAEIDELFEVIKQGNVNLDLLPSIDVEEEVKIENKEVECNVKYELPKEVATLEYIRFGTSNDSNGTLVNVVVSHPTAMAELDKKIDFEITFPDFFVLDTYAAAEQTEKYSLVGSNCIKVKDLEATGNKTDISFYIKEMIDVYEHIKNGFIDINEKVTYSINYKVNGSLKPSSKMTRESFDFDVDINVPLKFSDIKGATKDIKVQFEPVNISLDAKMDNLEDVQKVDYVEFDKNESMLHFIVKMQTDWLSDFNIKSGYALKVAFPQGLIIDDEISTYEGKGDGVKYNADDHAFYITDLNALEDAQWDLALERLNLNIPVVEGVCDFKDLKASILFVDENKQPVDSLVLEAAEFESLAATLNRLEGNKSAEFNMLATDLIVVDAVVETDVIEAELKKTTVDFSLDEEMPDEIGRIDGIGFAKDVAMKVDIDVNGLENLNTDIDFDIKLQLPSFLKIAKSPNNSPDVDITIENGELEAKACYHPMLDEKLSIELLCQGLDFLNEEFDSKGLMPKDSSDGKKYLSYPAKVFVMGSASIKGTEFHSAALGKMVEVNVDMVVDEIDVKYFHGQFCGDLGKVENSIDIDLGEELAFLREEGNSITLAEPQIEFVLNNTVAIPVDINMHIFGKNELGEVISTSEIEKTVTIKAAEYNEETGEIIPVETKLFITNDVSKNSKEGYENIEIKNLAHLLEDIPYSIELFAEPVVRTDVAHHIDFGQPIRLDGSYAIHVPLKFDELTLSYNDVIELGETIDETLDMFSNVGLKVKMDVINTIPLGLTFDLTPLDVEGKKIEDLDITPLTITAGDGGYIVDKDGNLTTQKATPFEFAITSKSGDISALSKLAFEIKAEANSTVGGAALRGDQGIRISDIVFEVSGDIEVDLSNDLYEE